MTALAGRANALSFALAHALVLAAPALVLPGCAAPSADDVAVAVAVAVAGQSIVGGATAAACSWPSTVLAGGCSGILVHPRVVVTAAHCVRDGIRQIDFGENERQVARSVRISACTAHPSYNGNTDDIGVCVLAEDVGGVPIIPLMAACEAAMLTAGAAVMEVGFGQFVAPTGPNDGFGVKRWMAATIRTVAANRGQIDATTGSQNGEYYGDSGGPLNFQMPDGTWRAIGADSNSPDIIPNSMAPRVSTYTSVPSHVAWLEATSGIDLTPCHDANGWNPTAACAGFPTNPADGVGTWATSCAGQTLVGPRATCGGGGNGTGGVGGGGAGGGSAAGGRDATGGATGGTATTGGAPGTGGREDGTGGASGEEGGAGSTPGATHSSDGGCGCATAGGAPNEPLTVLGLLGLLALGRRSRSQYAHRGYRTCSSGLI